ncbi:MAG TPA: Na+/H+ antiporter [Candidatus Sulfotelmatobacter sp.]|jgi:Na+/H+ antiporter|nr:Na+/H+ antiporter [Candidatus Sulfotelmatobacter sp.]
MIQTVEILFGLMIAIATLAVAARKLGIAYPIPFVIGGLVLGMIPGLPQVHLNPDLVFLIFLPPLIYPAALFTSWRDFRANLRPISMLAIRLVIISTVVIGFVAHNLVGLPWAAAFVLGAIVSPPDAVAATAITKRLRVPRHIITIIEGESLVNDATALVIYRFAVAAVVTGTFSLALAGLEFILVSVGGVLVGAIIGWLASQIQRQLDDPPVQTTLSLLTPFAAYLSADKIGVSGVLAVVTAGLYLGWKAPEIINSRTRFQLFPVWEMVVFFLNGLIFILIGLQLPEILENLSGQSLFKLCWQAALLNLTLIFVRIAWVFAAKHLPELFRKRNVKRSPPSDWRHTAIVAWTGMRGVDSMAAAMALPLFVSNGSPFPGRDLILFHTFAVILVTLVFQGLSLPLIIRWLRVEDDGVMQTEELQARVRTVQAALARLNEFKGKSDDRVLDRLLVEYTNRIHDLELGAKTGENISRAHKSTDYEQLLSEALLAERRMILQLRNEKVINDEVLRRIQRDLDLAELRLTRTGQ